MSALEKLAEAISTSLEEAPTHEVLAIITGTFVALTVELVRRNGDDSDKQITIDGGHERDITIHAVKEV